MMSRVLALGVLALAVALAASAPASSTPPPGATALCRDGTYSFSKHRSGTCSHHGGVARWLTGSGSSNGASGRPTSVQLGRTTLLAPRTRTSGCTLGANPDRRCSPGAYYSGLTQGVLCSSSFRTSSIRNVLQSEKYAVEQEYGLALAHYGSTLEIDHIVSLELGGSNDIANLFPEKANANPGYHVKDRLENKLHDLVCAGSLSLRSVQRAIASNWQLLYKQVYGVSP